MSNFDTKELIKAFIINIGENPYREGLKETPARVERMLEELFGGYNKHPKDIFKCFDGDKCNGEIVKVESIPFCSFCEHHLLPFFGTVDIVYKPNGRILGLSKFARLINIFSKRLQLQERLTQQIADALMEYLKPKGCVVTIRAEHLCMTIRGVQKLGSKAVTECQRGTID